MKKLDKALHLISLSGHTHTLLLFFQYTQALLNWYYILGTTLF
jgi:hypothetical protein